MQDTMRITLPPPGGSMRDRQWSKLKRLLQRIVLTDNFNSTRLRGLGVDPLSLGSLEEYTARMPFTSKEDLLADHLAHPPFGTNFTEPLKRYTHFCQTSGTSSGQPMAVLDTRESWGAMLNCWRQVFHAAGLQGGEDRIFFAFSFGPFLGFWTAFEAAAATYMVLPGGGLSSQARLEMMARYRATVLCCTPTYALRLGESIGAPSGIPLEHIKIKKIIVAGECGGSLPTTRARLRELWGDVEIYDHHGMTEVGPVSYEDRAHPGSLCIMEDAYFAEVLDAEGREVPDGGEGELVLTTLDRTACPLFRYRTGDWVSKHLVEERLFLEGGILSRCDDMVVVRGVNIYPSAVENIVRRFPEIVEFMVEQRNVHNMEELELLVEVVSGHTTPESVVAQVEVRLRDTFALRIPVHQVREGTLPRFEFKARRWRKI